MGYPMFENIPEKSYLNLTTAEGNPNRREIMEFLEFDKKSLSKATDTPIASIRDDKMPTELRDRLIEIAHVCERVANFFNGNIPKTALWFKLPNPMLGYVSPRDMIRFGRYKKLLRFIEESLKSNLPPQP